MNPSQGTKTKAPPKGENALVVNDVAFVKSTNFKNTYANTFRVLTGATEVSVVFGFQTQIPNMFKGTQIVTPTIEDEVAVILSPTTLKVLSEQLKVVVADIEKATGPIEIPERILSAIGLKIA
ncbi:hypothetical protein MSC49_16040 [Methylosinus sp. C49]|uniref:DUF3467 domain-containing protein n=1 Tax=Methylosinus sp. C49 TaxID=2699395 RepID=UPI001366C00F|nr:DUF3467 domain-containing protein [Methylosinus sp. C49]BBU61669.1 hypothetical protein MSC49_16040 [Methylosinus sp. C49]